MHHYLKFEFDLGYGYGLPILIEIDKETKEKTTTVFSNRNVPQAEILTAYFVLLPFI